MRWLRLALSGNLAAYIQSDAQAAHAAVQSVIRRKTALLKKRLRTHVVQRGLGEQLAKGGIRSAIQGKGINTAGAVFSNATYKRPGGRIDLINVFNEGATIRATHAKALFIGGRLLGKGGGRFARAQSVTIRKVLDIEPIFDKTVADIDLAIVLEWDKRVERIAARLGVAA